MKSLAQWITARRGRVARIKVDSKKGCRVKLLYGKQQAEATDSSPFQLERCMLAALARMDILLSQGKHDE